jgi:MFS transporter, DHA1 family, multidrug resistance protein
MAPAELSPRLLTLLLLPSFVVAFGYIVVLPIMPALLARVHTPVDSAAIALHTGWVAAIYIVGAVVFAPVWGYVSDRFGRRRVMVAALAGYALTIAWFAVSTTLLTLYSARFLAGAFAAAALPVATAYAAEATSRAHRSQTIGWITGGASLGFLFGPAVAGALHALVKVAFGAQEIPNHWLTLPVWLTGFIAVVGLIVVFVFLPERSLRNPSDDGPEAAPESVRRGLLTTLLVLTLLSMLSLGSLEVGLSLKALQAWPAAPGRVSILFTVCSAVMLLSQLYAFARLRKRCATWLIAAGSLVVMTLSFVALVVVGARYDSTLLIVGVIAAAVGLLSPSLSELTASFYLRSRMGIAAGWQSAAGNIGQAFGSLLAGWLYGQLGGTVFVATALLLALAASVSLLLRPRVAVAVFDEGAR